MAHRQTSLSSVSADLLPTGFRAIARPDEIRFSDALPKTCSGKIMRRLLRSLAAGEEVSGDSPTLEDSVGPG